MESVIQGQVLGVSSSPTRNGKVKYEVAFSDGNTYVTFDPQLAQKAANHQGQQVEAKVAVQQNGQWTNFYFNDVGPLGMFGGAAGGAQPLQGAVVGAGTIQSGGTITPKEAPSGGGGGRGMSEEDKQRVSRFAAQGSAFEFVGSIFAGSGPEGFKQALEYAEALTERLVKHAYTGSFDGIATAPAQTTLQPVAGTPEGVAQWANGEGGAIQVGVGAAAAQDAAAEKGDDIPWD